MLKLISILVRFDTIKLYCDLWVNLNPNCNSNTILINSATQQRLNTKLITEMVKKIETIVSSKKFSI